MSGMQACRSIVRGEVDYGKKCWSRVSPLAREFVASLLRKEPASRPSAAQVQPARYTPAMHDLNRMTRHHPHGIKGEECAWR